MKTRTREIAKAGIFGSKDDPQIVTEHDLKEIAETFGEVKSAPVVFGHWGNAEAPRLGNVVSVSYDAATKSLTGQIEEDDTLAAAVDAGYYPDVSIRSRQRASDGKMYLVHLAYLGQEAPAIKNLVSSIQEPLGIAASETVGLRAFPSPSEKQLYLSDTPPENFINKNMESIPKPGAGQPSSLEGSPGAAVGGDDSAKQNEEVSTMTAEEEKKLREENERLKAEAKDKDIALSEASQQQRKTNRERLRSVMDEKGMPKPVQEKALALSDALEEGKTLELSDSDAPEGKRKVSSQDCLIEIVSAFTKPVEPGVMNLSDGENTAGSAGNTGRINLSQI